MFFFFFTLLGQLSVLFFMFFPLFFHPENLSHLRRTQQKQTTLEPSLGTVEDLNCFLHIILTSDRGSFDWKIKTKHRRGMKKEEKGFQKRNGIPVYHKESWLKGIIKARERPELLKSRWDFRADAGGQHSEKGERPHEGPRW